MGNQSHKVGQARPKLIPHCQVGGTRDMVRTCLGPGVSLLHSPDPNPTQGLLEVCVLWGGCLGPELDQHPQGVRGVRELLQALSPVHALQPLEWPRGPASDQLWQAESAASTPFHKCLIQALLSSLLNPAAVKSFPGWELLQDVWYQWPLCCLLQQHFYFPSHMAAGGRCWFMPVTYPVLEPKGSQGELSSCHRCWSKPWADLSEVNGSRAVSATGDFPPGVQGALVCLDVSGHMLLKLLYDRQCASCVNVAVSLLSIGDFVWGICFPTTQKFILKIPCSVGFP